jgi:DNA repair exonuclease SbcCD ATPase subunit
MLPRIALLGLVLCFMTNGCASLSKEECATADWAAIGYGDGSHGKPASRFNAHQEACAEHGLKADFSVYKEGHQRGLQEVYCKPRNGYQLGLRGAGYNNVCPAAIEPTFLTAYHSGRGIHSLQLSYNVLNQQAGKLKRDLAAVDEHIATLSRDNPGDEWADRANRERKLKRERRQTEALYDRIKLARPMAQQSRALTEHVRQELTEQKKRVEQFEARLVEKLGPQDHTHRQFRSLVRLSIEKGHLESQMKWVNRTPAVAHTSRKSIKTMQRQLRDLMPKIDRVKHELNRNQKDKKDPHGRRSRFNDETELEQLMEQAEYEGALRYHNEVLAYMASDRGSQSDLYLLIDAHFKAELVNFDQCIDDARHRPPTEEERKAQIHRKRELQDAQRQYDDYLHRLETLEQQMDNTQQKIEQLKSASGY